MKTRPVFVFFLFTLAAIGMSCVSLGFLVGGGVENEQSYILLIPFTSAWLIYIKRQAIFGGVRWAPVPGITLSLLGSVGYFLGSHLLHASRQNDFVSLMMLCILLFWIGGYVLCFGTAAFRKALFPLLFLSFMIPLPGLLMTRIVSILQIGSTWMTFVLFKVVGIPFELKGFVFHCRNLNIEVAETCSGIRSSLTLLIAGILVSHLFLKTYLRRLVLVFAVFPLAFLKNGIRILTLSAFALYVDREFLPLHYLHRYGGIIFFLLALLLLWIILRTLRKSEFKRSL
ncbi:MAG: Transmembrane exosortase (Exosortase_EpsH) [Syntrophorhabdus sp. PtaU1.Bin050]|jgi:exosortase|nr:MAG: Transmembrane exosortase (Exosortase_EpsH) [Syntrophorhabdus sp. PtaU1.Bin050]